MNKIVNKSVFIYEYEEIENWLNQMADDGLSIKSVKSNSSPTSLNSFGNYEFEQTDKGEYKISMLLLDKKHTSPESKDKIEFIEQTGAKFVGMFDKWAIFRKKSECGEFKLLSDTNSQMKNISNIISRFVVKLVLAFLWQICLFFSASVGFHTQEKPLFILAIVLSVVWVFLSIIFIKTLISYISKIKMLSKKHKELKKQATIFE